MAILGQTAFSPYNEAIQAHWDTYGLLRFTNVRPQSWSCARQEDSNVMF